MIYRGIELYLPQAGGTDHLTKLQTSIPWYILAPQFPEIYRDSARLVSLYHMGLEVSQHGIIQYYQDLEHVVPREYRKNCTLPPCDECQCEAFQSLVRFARINRAHAKDNTKMLNAFRTFGELEINERTGNMKGVKTFETAFHAVDPYFFQICEQKALYNCIYLEQELAKKKRTHIPASLDHLICRADLMHSNPSADVLSASHGPLEPVIR